MEKPWEFDLQDESRGALMFGIVTGLRRHVQEMIEMARRTYLGAEVQVMSGRYRGRAGIIDGVIVDRDGEMKFLVMVLRAGSTEFLNSDGESRTYRPLGDFIVLAGPPREERPQDDVPF